MDTQEFSQRFGILLEAYLKGCGETMFVSRIHVHVLRNCTRTCIHVHVGAYNMYLCCLHVQLCTVHVHIKQWIIIISMYIMYDI